jgi:hypothetical protein
MWRIRICSAGCSTVLFFQGSIRVRERRLTLYPGKTPGRQGPALAIFVDAAIFTHDSASKLYASEFTAVHFILRMERKLQGRSPGVSLTPVADLRRGQRSGGDCRSEHEARGQR